MKIKVPTLETERLILRMWKKKDAPELYEYAKNPNVGPHAGWKPHASVNESRMIISQLFLTNMCWAIIDKESGKVIGSIGLEEDKFRPDIKSKELGYSLAEEYWGKGIMTEAAKRVIRHAFEELDCIVLSVSHFPFNQKSRRVIKKLGFAYEGVQRHAHDLPDGSVADLVQYSLLRNEYEAHKQGK